MQHHLYAYKNQQVILNKCSKFYTNRLGHSRDICLYLNLTFVQNLLKLDMRKADKEKLAASAATCLDQSAQSYSLLSSEYRNPACFSKGKSIAVQRI